LREAFHVDVGLSDHTLGAGVPVAAVVLGAVVIEKHFILNHELGGPDASFSLDPAEFKQMTELVRVAEQALGTTTFELPKSAVANRSFARSLFAVENVRAGESFTAANVRSIRPGNGLPPRNLGEVLGRVARRDISRGTPLSWDLIG
jgi:pseudaminic acid synthase